MESVGKSAATPGAQLQKRFEQCRVKPGYQLGQDLIFLCFQRKVFFFIGIMVQGVHLVREAAFFMKLLEAVKHFVDKLGGQNPGIYLFLYLPDGDPFSVVAYGGIGQKYIGFRNITAVKETFDVRIQRELQGLKACPEPVKVQRFHMGFHLIIQLFQIHGCSLLRDDRCFTARKETRKNQQLHPKRYRKSDNS